MNESNSKKCIEENSVEVEGNGLKIEEQRPTVSKDYYNESYVRDDEGDNLKKESNTVVVINNDDEQPYDDENHFGRCVIWSRKKSMKILKRREIKWIMLIALVILYIIYFGFAMKLSPPFNIPSNVDETTLYKNYIFSNNAGLALFLITIVVVVLLAWDYVIVKIFNLILYQKLLNRLDKISNLQFYIRWCLISVVGILCLVYLFLTIDDYKNLLSLFGLFCFILIGMLLSYKPSKINLRTVIVGILLQFILGVCTMRFKFGYELLSFLGNQVEHFLSFTDYGSRLVFGDKFDDHFFAFKAMPVLVFFGSVINVLYYYGVVQYVILKASWFVNVLMDTSPTESISTIADIFVGMSETCLLIKPFLLQMTDSELFAVMVGGFATVAGSVLAAYIGFGVPANHLIIASIMSAPASLVISKVIFPETEKTNADWESIRGCAKIEASSVFEVIATGAVSVAKVIAYIICCLIAFVSIFNFLDALVAWFLELLNIKNAGFATILQYLFWPCAALLGVPSDDCLSVAKYIGIKTFINEFVAYKELGDAINFRKQLIAANTLEFYKNGTMEIPKNITMIWHDKSIMISTYALCGFANFGSIGITIGSLSALCPSKAKLFSRVALKAMIAGNIAGMMTACIAGLLFKQI